MVGVHFDCFDRLGAVCSMFFNIHLSFDIKLDPKTGD